MYLYLLMLVTALSINVSAGDSCDIKTLQDFYNKVNKQGPIVEEAKRQREEALSVVDLAEQRPNPEIDFEYLKGDQFGTEINNYALSAKHIVELGSKRDKRVNKANNLLSLKSEAVDLGVYKSSIDASIDYQRIAQLDITISAVKEAIYTFNKLTKKLARRKRLNPEERVSLSTIKLAMNDYKAQLNDLENERDLIQGKLSFLVSCPKLKPIYSNLSFLEIDKVKKTDDQSGLIKLENLKVEVAKSEFDIEKSKGYSNIAIGPMVEYQTQGNDEFVSGGVAITFDLPLFHTNDGGKLNALKKLNVQKLQSKNKIELLNIRRERLLLKYNRSLRLLKKMPKLSELEKKHQKVERLFSRGLVSISMTIESHRQQIDFLQSLFETENDVLNTFGEISLIDGDTQSFQRLLK